MDHEMNKQEKQPVLVDLDQVWFSYPLAEDSFSEEEEQEDQAPYVLKDISFQVQQGEFVAIMGSNGSGKSSLARLLNAQYLPDRGRVKIFGMDSQEKENLWTIRSHCGLVFQNPDNQMVSSIIEEDVAFGPENLGIPNPELRERVDWALQAVGLYDLRDREVHDLSGGQKQRLAIAGLLAMKPDCLVLDEPTAMLDPQGRHEIMGILFKLNREEGMTILLITHHMEEAAQADRVLVLDQGRLVLDGPPKEVFARGKDLEAIGLDRPRLTLLAEGLRDLGLPLPPAILNLDEFLEAVHELTV